MRLNTRSDDLIFSVHILFCPSSPGASHLGRGGRRRGLSTCQDSHLAGKRGASQGSPLRVAPGVPLVWEGTPSPVQSDHAVNVHPCRARCRTPRTPHHRVRLHDHGAAMENSCWCRSGHSPLTVAAELVVSLKTTTLITVLLAAATAFTSKRKSGQLFIVLLMEKKAKLNAPLFSTRIRWRLRVCEGICSADPDCTQHSSIPKSEASVLFDLTTKSVKKLVVEPPATVALSLFVMSLSTLPSLRWS